MLRDTLVLEGITFDYDKADLLADDKEILDRVAVALLEPQWASARCEVAGHTSGIRTPEYNMDLSVQRANAVMAYLVVSKGVPAGRLTAWGYGESDPLYPNDDEGRNWPCASVRSGSTPCRGSIAFMATPPGAGCRGGAGRHSRVLPGWNTPDTSPVPASPPAPPRRGAVPEGRAPYSGGRRAR